MAFLQRKGRVMTEMDQAIAMVENREQWHIKNNEKAREDTGWFGKFHRVLTLSDPYAIEISNSKQELNRMQFIRGILEQATGERDSVRQLDLVNQARRSLGMRELNVDYSESEEAPVTRQKTVRGTEHFDVEQEAIDVSRDVAIEAGVTAATLGAGAVANLGKKGAQVAATEVAKRTFAEAVKQGAKEGAAMGAAMSGGSSAGRNIDDVLNNETTVGEAIDNVAYDTATGAAAGAVIGGALGGGVHGAKKGIDAIKGRGAAAAEAEQAGAKTAEGATRAEGTASENAGKSTSRERPGAQAHQEQAKANPRDTETPKGRTSESTASRSETNPKAPPGEYPHARLDPRANPYEVLGLKEGATWDEIASSYRKASMKYHPDRNPLHADQAKKDFQILENAFGMFQKKFSRKA